MAPMDLAIGNLLRLDVSVKFFLPIFQAHGDISRLFHAPEKIEIIPEALMLIQVCYRSK